MNKSLSRDSKGIGRRALLTRLGPGTAALCVAPAEIHYISAPDVVVYCDTTLTSAMRAAGVTFGQRTGVPVRVFAAAAPQSLALIAHGTRTDVLVTLASQMRLAIDQNCARAPTLSRSWHTRIVLAGKNVAPLAGLPSRDTLATLLGDAPLAVIDPTTPAAIDGPALAARLGWDGLKLAGCLDGPEVAYLLETGAARLGLLEQTDIAAHPNLSVVSAVPGELAGPRRYQAAMVQQVLSRNAAAFVQFLDAPEGTAELRKHGLEIEA